MEFINIGPVYIGGGEGGVIRKSLNKEEQDTNSIVQSNYDVYMHAPTKG